MTDHTRDEPTGEKLDDVRAYYDRIAPRLRAVEQQNWHLQSRMSCVLATIDGAGPGPGGRVLDVGCGGGFLLEELARLVPARRVVVARELTKRFELFYRSFHTVMGAQISLRGTTRASGSRSRLVKDSHNRPSGK